MIRPRTFLFARKCVLGFRRANSSTSLTLTTSALLTNLFQSCRSCGIKLQSQDANKPGYYILDSGKSDTKQAKKYVKHEDEVFNKYVHGLDLEDQKLLINDFSGSSSTDSEISQELLKSLKVPGYLSQELQKAANKSKLRLDEESDSLECIRCRDATYRSNFRNVSQTEYPVESLETIISPIPQDGKLVYIISAQDFPMSLNPKIFQFRSPRNIKFIVNKSDLLFKNNSLNLKYGLTFMQDYLQSKYGVPRENVTIVSGLINWNMKTIIDFIDDGSYIVGNVNSGKSTIIKSLLYYLNTQKKKKNQGLLSSRERTKLEKDQDRLIQQKDGIPEVSRYKLKKEAKEFEEYFKSKVGPGVSYMPGFTRGFIQIDLTSANKTIYDVPGFVRNVEDENHGLYKLIESNKLVKQVSKGVKVFEKGFYFSKYKTIKNGQCLTLGGLLYLNIPENSMFQVRNCINFDFKVFSNLKKAVDVSTNLQHYPGLRKEFFVNHTSQSISQLKRFVIPPFFGSIDLVIQNVGHLNIVPTGSKTSNEPLVLYLAPGVDAIIRQPITKYIAKSFTGRDANGNPLKKENYMEKSSFALQRYTAKSPFYSSLIATRPHELQRISEGIEIDETTVDQILNDDYESIEKWASLALGRKVQFDSNTTIGDANRYEFWFEGS